MLTILKTNVANVMLAANRKVQAKRQLVLRHQQLMDREIAKLIEDSKKEGEKLDNFDVRKMLGLNYQSEGASREQTIADTFADIPAERIFSEEAIKQTCIRYGLRFLPSSQYRGVLDAGIPAAIRDAQKILPCKALAEDEYRSYYIETGRTEVPVKWDFHIAAPKDAFTLEDRPVPPDPLLFLRLQHDHWYLVHKWGSDLSVFRRARVFFCRYLVELTAWLLAAFLTVRAWHFFRNMWGGYDHGPANAAFIATCIVLVISTFVVVCNRQWYTDPAKDWNNRFKD